MRCVSYENESEMFDAFQTDENMVKRTEGNEFRHSPTIYVVYDTNPNPAMGKFIKVGMTRPIRPRLKYRPTQTHPVQHRIRNDIRRVLFCLMEDGHWSISEDARRRYRDRPGEDASALKMRGIFNFKWEGEFGYKATHAGGPSA